MTRSQFKCWFVPSALLSTGGERALTSVTSFLFTLKNYEGVSPRKIDVKLSQRDVAASSNRSTGPIFGLNDLHIGDNANVGLHSFSDLGHGYQFTTYSASSVEARNFLAGSYYFIPDDIEVFNYEGEHCLLKSMFWILTSPQMAELCALSVHDFFLSSLNLDIGTSVRK